MLPNNLKLRTNGYDKFQDDEISYEWVIKLLRCIRHHNISYDNSELAGPARPGALLRGGLGPGGGGGVGEFLREQAAARANSWASSGSGVGTISASGRRPRKPQNLYL